MSNVTVNATVNFLNGNEFNPIRKVSARVGNTEIPKKIIDLKHEKNPIGGYDDPIGW